MNKNIIFYSRPLKSEIMNRNWYLSARQLWWLQLFYTLFTFSLLRVRLQQHKINQWCVNKFNTMSVKNFHWLIPLECARCAAADVFSVRRTKLTGSREIWIINEVSQMDELSCKQDHDCHKAYTRRWRKFLTRESLKKFFLARWTYEHRKIFGAF